MRLSGRRVRSFRSVREANEARELRDQLYAWYKDHAFPTYQPEMESITTVSGAIECAVSVGNYMKATGYEMGDAGRKARCAAVTGETAAKAVELLNIHFGFEEAPRRSRRLRKHSPRTSISARRRAQSAAK